MPLPAIIVTGASGFVGRHFLDEIKNEYRIFAIARRSQRECGAPVHPNIAWMQVDVGDVDGLGRTFREIATAGGARLLFHLAAYYDFAGENRPEYRRTNVEGTRNILTLARTLKLDRFVFASSVAACGFPRPEGPIGATTPPDGHHVYAWSKRLGEEMVTALKDELPSCIMRFGAVYSDWCEYPPLYMFLNTWLGGSWKARILAGRGASAIPYVHVRDIVSFLKTLLVKHGTLDSGEVLVASTSGCTSHLRLHQIATRFFFGAARRPVFLPRPLCGLGLVGMTLLGRVTRRMPFERPWMYRYIDQAMEVDSSRTAARIGWTPSPRLHIERRLPFLIERLKSEAAEWHHRNALAMRRGFVRPGLAIYRDLVTLETEVVEATAHRLASSPSRAPALAATERGELVWFVRLIYQLLLTSVQSTNRMLVLNYLEVTALSRFRSGVSADELCLLLDILNEEVVSRLSGREELREFRGELHDRISVPLEFGKDEIQEQYERFAQGRAASAQGRRRVASETHATAQQLLEETIWQSLVQRR